MSALPVPASIARQLGLTVAQLQVLEHFNATFDEWTRTYGRVEREAAWQRYVRARRAWKRVLDVIHTPLFRGGAA